ncbi:MAG: hypothetical protein LV479_01360 [Methylacidiphilales bacterium]|nr:hypothetical protein [Candidatus Methylacidiphilales bacterium]
MGAFDKSQSTVVELARRIHQENWKDGSHVSTQTRSAQRINREWQEAVLNHFGARFHKEYPVASLSVGHEKIDLVDIHEWIAFELKVSPKNTHFEFYRDIFKLAVHNQESQNHRLVRLVFITPQKGAKRLLSAFVKSVSSIADKKLDFEVEVVGI